MQKCLPGARGMNPKSWIGWLNPTWVLNAIVAASIFATSKIAFSFASIHEITPVWPASGIALAAFLLFGTRTWFGVLLGYWITNTHLYQSIPFGSMMFLSEASEAIIAALLIHRLIRRHDILSCTQHVIYFVLAATLASAVNASLGTLLLYLHGKIPDAAYLGAWRTWWTADTVGILIFTPFLMSWLKPVQKRNLRSWRTVAEFALLTVTIAFTSKQVLGKGEPLEYLFLPLIVWSAFRFGKRCTTLLLVFISLASVGATAQGYGTFLAATQGYGTLVQTSQNDSLVLLQSFIGVVTITALILSSVITEREQAEDQLKKANETLENRVEERTSELSKTLMDLRRTQAQLVQNEKMSSLGQLVAGVAHEINNPINFIYGNLNPAQEYTQDLLELLSLYQHDYPTPSSAIQAKQEAIDLEFLQDDLPKLLSSMRLGSERIQNIVKSLRNFSRLDEAEFKAVDIHEGIDSTLMILQNRLKAKPDRPGIEIIKQYGQLPSVNCYPGELNQVFMNILTNAIDALEEKLQRSISESPASELPAFSPLITIHTQPLNHHQVIISIADNGLGMSETVRSRLFDPFYTTKPVGIGTGLGLSISYQIVTERHGGKLTCHSEPEQGTKFVIEIPVQQVIRTT